MTEPAHPSPTLSETTKPHVHVVTLGCRLNSVESELIKNALHTHAAPDQNYIVINSCAVTAQAVRDTKQTIRKMARSHPHARIIVTGCAAQIEPDSFAAMTEVSHIIGNDRKTDPATWSTLATSTTERVRVNDWASLKDTASAFEHSFAIDHRDGHTRAFVEVQNGCDHRCTFCIIPYGRGPARSSPAGAVVEQIKNLVANGYQEVVLTGVDLTSWGQDLPATPKLGALVRQILRFVPELKRLRLSSLDCIEADDDLMRALAEEDRLMPHLHLSLQAGDDMILKRMKRRHLRADAIAFCTQVRKRRPDIVFGADIIVGFPTETDDMFAQSLALVDDCGLTHLHVFPFSPRTGTPAAKMPAVHGAIIKQRASQLRRKGEGALIAHLDQKIGGTYEVLTERGGLARMRDFTSVHISADTPIDSGLIGMMHITHREGATLHGVWQTNLLHHAAHQNHIR
jgi:threonylcarbamoyladenosine tRNA methylthiotransferase MtaB